MPRRQPGPLQVTLRLTGMPELMFWVRRELAALLRAEADRDTDAHVAARLREIAAVFDAGLSRTDARALGAGATGVDAGVAHSESRPRLAPLRTPILARRPGRAQGESGPRRTPASRAARLGRRGRRR
jgi:hypothetical protein